MGEVTKIVDQAGIGGRKMLLSRNKSGTGPGEVSISKLDVEKSAEVIVATSNEPLKKWKPHKVVKG